MKKILLSFIIILTLSKSYAQTSVFNDLLRKYVTNTGIVDYKKFNGEILKKHITYLENTSPKLSWSNNKQKAFWINAYNAYTIYLVLHAIRAEKIESIMDITKKGKTTWKIPFVKVGNKTYTLDYIEHEILRKKFSDPKIHFGINCASTSCPKLSNKAFTEENIEIELTRLMKDFINDTSKNKISQNEVQISPIFDWFHDDFTKNGSLINFLNNYSKTKISPKAKISFLKYDWTLNGK